MNTNLNMQTLPIDKLKPAKYKPRKELQPGDPAYEKIKRSLHDFGYCDADTEGLNFRRAFKESGFHISGVCIWVKNSLVLGRSPYQWQHEPVLFGWLPNGKHKWFSDRKQSTIWNFDKPKKSADHPTMKPIPLLCYPIKNIRQHPSRQPRSCLPLEI